MIQKCQHCENGIDKDLFGFGPPEPKKCYWCDGIGFKCNHTDEIVCPYCGHESSDSWESHESKTHQCGECGKWAALEIEHSVSYSTSKVECLNDESKHEWEKNKGYEDQLRNGKSYAYCKKCREYKWVELGSSK